MACRITRDKDGNIQSVKSENGRDSKLFQALRTHMSDEEALQKYAAMTSPQYTDALDKKNSILRTKDENNEPLITTAKLPMANTTTLQRFAQKWNINESGFTQSSAVNNRAMANEASKMGLGVAKAKTGNYYLTRNNKKINPWKIELDQSFIEPITYEHPLGKSLMNLKGKKNKKWILDTIKANGSVYSYEILKMIEDNMSDDLTIELDTSMNKAGEYDFSDHSIKINPNRVNARQAEYVLLHELIHDSTVHVLQRYQDKQATKSEIRAVENLMETHRQLKQYIRQDKAKGMAVSFRAENSFAEFLADIFTDPDLQAYMNNKRTNKSRSLWQVLINTLMRLLRIRPGSLMEEAVFNSFILMDTAPKNTMYFQEKYSALGQREYQFYTQVADKLTPKQAQTMRHIIDIQSRYKLSPDQEHYTDVLEGINNLDRVSNRLDDEPGPRGQIGYYAFDATIDPSLYEDNREWGNQTDMILEGIILEKKFGSIIDDIHEYQRTLKTNRAKLSDKVILQTYNSLKTKLAEEKKRHKGMEFMSQITLGNTDKKVAGTLDLIGILPDGTIVIYDLKSSEKTTIKPYKVTTKGGTEADNSYNTTFPGKSSKKGRHSGQLSFYKGIAFSKGLPVIETNIIALHLGSLPEGGGPIDAAKVEAIHRLDTVKDITKTNSYDTGFESAYAAGRSLSELESTAHKIQLALQSKLDDYIAKNNMKGARYIRSIQEAIAGLEEVKAIEEFVSEAFKSIVENKNNKGVVVWNGYFQQAQNFIQQVHEGKKGGLEALNELYHYKEIFDLYDGTINDIKIFYNRLKDEILNADEGSTAWKVDKLEKFINSGQDQVKAELNHLSAQILAKIAKRGEPEIDKAKKDIQRQADLKIARHQKSLDELKRRNPDYENTKTYKRLTKTITKLRQDAEAMIRVLSVDYDSIKHQLDNGADKDIGILQAYFTPGIQNSNAVISTFVRLLKDEFEDTRYKLLQTRDVAELALKEWLEHAPSFRDNPARFNEGLFEVVSIPRADGTTSDHYSFISDINWTKFEKAKAEMFVKSKEIEDNDKRRSFIQSWMKANMEFIPMEDETITNPYTKEVIVTQMGRKTMYAHLEERMGKKAFGEMVIRMKKGIVPREFMRPRKYGPDGKSAMYLNPKYLEIQKDPHRSKYHTWLLATYLKSQKMLPAMNKPYRKFFIPTRLRTDKERILQNPQDYAIYEFERRFKKRPEDVEQYGSERAEIPVMYRWQRMPLKDVSLDLLRSVLEFEHEALKYDTRTNLLALSRYLVENAQEKMPAKTEKGKTVLKKARVNLEKHATNLGIPNFNDYLRNHNNSYIAAMMEGLVDMHILNKFKKRQIAHTPVGSFDLGKWADALISFSSYTQIGMTNPLLGVSNSLMAESQVLIEAMAGKHYNAKDWAWAEAYYDTHIPDMLNDFSKPVAKSLIGQIIDLYDPLQGEFLDMMGRKISSTAYSRILSSDSWFWLIRQGEHHAQVKSLLAMLRSQKVMQNGKEISLIDAYEIGSKGEIKLKDGVQKLDEANGLVASRVKNRLHSINKGMHGVYNSFDRVLAERDAMGRLLTMYRKFVVTGFKRRFDPLRRDMELEDATEGTYRTFMRILQRDFRDAMASLVPGTDTTFKQLHGELTDLERENLLRALSEFGFIFSTGAALMAFQQSPPDEEDWAMNVVKYELLRVNSELGFFMGLGDPRMGFLPNPMDAARMFKTPAIGLGTVNKFVRLVFQLFSDPTETYQRDAGIAQKGDLKLKILLRKLLGNNGYFSNPDQAIKVLEMQLR